MAEYIRCYGVCDSKCKREVVSREEIEAEYYSAAKIITQSRTELTKGSTEGDIVCEYGKTFYFPPTVFPSIRTPFVSLYVKQITSTSATIHYTINSNVPLASITFDLLIVGDKG